MTKLTIALSKGRILKDTLPLLKQAGIELLDDPKESRKLILRTTLDTVNVVVVRPTDVPTFVQYGAADIGVTGKDILMEHGAQGVYEPLDLGIAKCRLMVAGLQGVDWQKPRLRVATKYTNLARAFFTGRGQQAEMIKLYGAMELAPIVGLADVIVDLVDTGNTLKANGLVPYEEVAQISSRVVVNKAAMKTKYNEIQNFIEKLQEIVS